MTIEERNERAQQYLDKKKVIDDLELKFQITCLVFLGVATLALFFLTD